jgi:phytoene desaturase
LHFITEARNYDIAIKDLVYRPGSSPLELVTVETTKKIGQFFISRRYIKILKRTVNSNSEFPVLF